MKLQGFYAYDEVYSLMICILLGLVLGLLTVPWISHYGDGHPDFQFPTAEMVSRHVFISYTEFSLSYRFIIDQ